MKSLIDLEKINSEFGTKIINFTKYDQIYLEDKMI